MIYRDSRQMARDPQLGTIVFVFSDTDPQEVLDWAKMGGIPTRGWDAEKHRLKVYGRHIIKALGLKKAPVGLLAKLKKSWRVE